MRSMWPQRVKIFWDPWRNIPVIKPRQEEIDLLYQLKLSEPGDARPAFRGDIERLKTAIEYELGEGSFYRSVLEDKFILLNKVPHWDIMYEVVASGNVIGQLYYDPYSSRWRFRLTYQGAYIALQEGLVEAVKGDPPFYVGKSFGFSRSTSSKQVVVVDDKGVIRGIGEVEGDKATLIKVFYDRSLPVETSNKNASLHDVVNYNSDRLELLEEKAINYLKRVQGRFGNLKPVVSYSGGKDSLVSLDLACKAFGDVEVIFNDTGLELPETINNVNAVSESYSLKLHVASANGIFWRAIEVFGPPGKDYRWCCKVTKLVPIAKLTKTMWPTGALNIVGQRAYESLDRAKSPLVWRNKWIPHMISTTPIQYWSQLTCWLYIFKYKLPYNKLYEEGFDRLGCYLCPSCALAEFEDVKRTYPDLWSKWESVLEKWREKLGLPPEWVKLGLWRWLTPATAKRRITHRLQNYTIDWRAEYSKRLETSKVELRPVESISSEKSLLVKFNQDLISAEVEQVFVENVVNMGFKVRSLNPLVLEKDGRIIEISGESIKLHPSNEEAFEDLVDIVKVAYRARGCVLCGSCVLWSKKGAVRLTPKGPLLREKLVEKEARVYIEVCPISDQLVEKVVVPLITGTYKSFQRKTRRKPLVEN